MAAAVENPRERPRLVLAVGVLAAVFVGTRVALMWRFPWFVDERRSRTSPATCTATWDPLHRPDRQEGAAAVVAGRCADRHRDRAAHGDAPARGRGSRARRGLRRSHHAAAVRAARRTADRGADRARALLLRDRLGRHLRRDGHGPRGRCRAGLAPARAEAPPVHRAPARQPARSGRPDQADGVDRDRGAAVHARPLRLAFAARTAAPADLAGARRRRGRHRLRHHLHRPLHAALRPAARGFRTSAT